MQYTESELQAWSNAADFFEPNGVLDIDACEKYYGVHLAREMHAPHIKNENGELLFALMKKTVDMPQAQKTFARVYNALRSDSPRLQPFLNHMAQDAPDILRNWFKEASLNADLTSQILLLRDVKQWLPNEDVGQYTNAAILTMKPSAFVKKFSPDVSDMEPLLEVAQAFQTKPEYAHLGSLMLQGIFIALYGKEHKPQDPDDKTPLTIAQSLETKYSARAAFGLMQRTGIRLPPSDLMELIKARYRAQCLESDALAYTYESLNSAASPEQREYGLQVLDTVLQAQTKKPDFLYNKGLLHVYAVLEKDQAHDNALLMQRIKGALFHHIDADEMPARSMNTVTEVVPSLASAFLDALQKRAKDPQNQKLLGTLYMGRHDQIYQPLVSWHLPHPEQLRVMSQQRATPQQITQLFENEFDRILEKKLSDQKPRNPLSIMEDLQSAMRQFVRHEWPQEKLEHLKNDPVLPKWVLTQLCLGACATTLPGLQRSVMPQLNADPLPLLRRLYPEHNALWNTMVKAMLTSEVKDLPSYQKQQTQLFNIFSSAFLPGKPTMADMKIVSETMGMTVLDYVVTACGQAHALVLPELDGSVFDMDM